MSNSSSLFQGVHANILRPMVYLWVFLASLLGILTILGIRVLLRNRTIRRFVRSIKVRLKIVEDRHQVHEESENTSTLQKLKKSPRTSAIELQQMKTILKSAEKEIALQNFERAEYLLIQGLTINAGYLEIQAELAKLYLTTHREAKAEALYKEMILQKDDISFFTNLGLAYYLQGKYVDACHAYQEALNRDPQTPERSVSLAKACIAAHRFAEAVPLLEKAVLRISRDTELLHLLAECYVQLGDKLKAEESYRRINKLEPYDENVKEKISALRATNASLSPVEGNLENNENVGSSS